MTKLNLQECAQLFLQEEIAIVDTETLVGISGIFSSRKALTLIRELKQKEQSSTLSVIANSLEMAQEVGVFCPLSLELAKTFYPFATIVVPSKHPNFSTLGIRVTHQIDASQLITLLGQPIFSTSANLHGQPPAVSLEEALKLFALPYLTSTTTGLKTGKPSTVINTMNNQIHRSSAIEISLLKDILAKHNKSYQVVS